MKKRKIIILFFLVSLGLRLNAATYYLKVANAGSADQPSSWNTAANGSGSNLSSWTTASTNDTYIIPIGVDGVWTSSQTIGNAGVGAQSYTFIVNGTLNIDAADRITFAGTANSVTFTVNGTLSIDETNDETFLTSDVNFAYFIFSADSKLISNNYRGIYFTGLTNLIFEDDVDFRFLFDPEADFEFINTSVATNLYGLNDTVGTLIIATPGLATRVRTGTVLVVLEELIISSGTLNFATLNLRLASTATFNHSAGTLQFTSGDFYIDGLYSHSSGTFTHTGCEVIISSTGTLHLNTGVFNMQGRTMTVAGTITRTSGSIYFSPTLGDLVFANSTQITIPQNAFLNHPVDMLLNGSGGVVLGGNTRPSATDTIYTVTFTLGNLTLTSGITAITRVIGSGGNIIGNQTASLVFIGTSTSTLYMDQTTPGTTNALGTLALNGSASNITLGTNLYIHTTLTLNSRTIALGTFTLTKNGNFSKGTEIIQLNTGVFNILGTYTHTNTGTFTFATGILSVGSLDLPSGGLNISTGKLQISGSVSRTTGTIYASSGTVEFLNTSSVNIPSNTFIRYPLNCIINGVGGVVFNGNTRTAATDSFPSLTLTSGSLSLFTGNTAIGTLTRTAGDITGNATASLRFFGSGTRILYMNQTTPGTSNALGTLILNGTVDLTLGSNLNVNTTLTLNSRTLNLGSFTLTKTDNFSKGTEIIQLSSGNFTVSGAYTHTSSGTLTFSTGTLAVGSLVMTTGEINVSLGILSIGGAVSRGTGQISAPGGTVRFTNGSAVTLPSNTFSRYPANFILNGAGGVTLGGKTVTLKDSLGNLTFTSGNLTVTTDTTCIGSITGSGGNVVSDASASIRFYGSSSSTLRTSQTTPGTSNAVKNVMLTGTSSVTLGNALRIAPNGLVNIPTGTTFTTGGNLTLTSTASGHGRIGNVEGTLNSSSTDSIQIYAEGSSRGFRLFGNPFTSALALSQYTDNATEIDITGTGGSGNGFTTTINNNPSAFQYSTSADSFQAYTAISQTIGVGNGAYIMVRGTRGQGLNGSVYTPNATTIRLAGQLNSGSVDKTLSNANYGWNLIANPYPSNIDLDLVSNGDWAGIDLTIYGYDKRNKAFSVYTKGTGGANKVNNISNIIQMGSSFFVQANSPVAHCHFRENTKTDLSSTVSSNPIFTEVDDLKDRFKMSLTGIVKGDTLTDECLLSFGNREQATAEYEENRDAWDLGGEELTIGIVTPLENILAINEYPALSEIKSPIGLHVWVRQPGTYKLNFRDIAPMDWKIQVWLRDKFTNTVTHIQQKGEYEFVVSDAPESQGTQRFELFTMKNVTGTEELTGNAKLKIFPNPINSSTQNIDLVLAGEGHGQVAVKIIDMMGREIYNAGNQIHIPNQAIQITIPRNLIPQTYILVCESNKGMFQQQISINNQ